MLVLSRQRDESIIIGDQYRDPLQWWTSAAIRSGWEFRPPPRFPFTDRKSTKPFSARTCEPPVSTPKKLLRPSTSFRIGAIPARRRNCPAASFPRSRRRSSQGEWPEQRAIRRRRPVSMRVPGGNTSAGLWRPATHCGDRRLSLVYVPHTSHFVSAMSPFSLKSPLPTVDNPDKRVWIVTLGKRPQTGGQPQVRTDSGRHPQL